MSVEWVDADSQPVSGEVEVVDETVPHEFVATKTLGLGFWLSIGWLAVVVGAAILAPVLPLKDPRHNFVGGDAAGASAAPSFEHWFGTDEDALDVFSRTVHGARVSLVVGFSAILTGMIVGGSLGLITGYLKGWFDKVVSFVFLILLSFPALVLAILLTALLDRSLFTIAAIIGVLSIAPVGRLARAATIQFAERDFVLAAQTLGAKKSRIMMRELLPNVVIPLSALGLLGMAIAIIAESSLAFLGLSVEQSITWGTLIQRGAVGRRVLEDAPWIAIAPILVLFLTVLALNYAGDRIRDYFDVKELSL